VTTVPILPGAATVVLDGSGGGKVKLGPAGAREVWDPDSASVSVSSNVKEAQCRIYVGDSPVPASFRDGTLSGSTGDSSGRVGGPVKVGWFVWAVWSGGDAGAVATLNVTGMREV
jgi:hypothetical protein